MSKICDYCQKSTWNGCGVLVDAEFDAIPIADRCSGWQTGVCPERVETEKAITNEMLDHRPMIGELSSPSQLLPDYATADLPGFIPGIEYLASKYQMRRIRGDGNCFYRAFLFSYLEQLLSLHSNSSNPVAVAAAENEKARMYRLLEESKNELIILGYDEVGIECFHDAILELVNNLFSMTRESLLADFQEDGQSDYYTWFMRLLTAGAMIKHEERFYPFIMDSMMMDMRSYAKAEIEPMGKECEQVHIIALSEYLGVAIRIEYLDGRSFDPEQGLHLLSFPESSATTEIENNHCSAVTLLYRPGHYDILYPMAQSR